MDDDFDKEQRMIIRETEKIQECYRGKGLGWNGFRGMVTLNIVGHYIERYLGDRPYRIAKLAWVEKCSMEFDLMIIRRDAEVIRFTPAYRSDDVLLVVEVKAAGIFWKLVEIEEKLNELREKANKPGKPWLYLTLWESSKRAAITTQALGEEAFILRTGTGKRQHYRTGEWKRFVDRINYEMEASIKRPHLCPPKESRRRDYEDH